MTYSANRQIPQIESNFFAILKPRFQVKSWTLISGTTYSAPYDFDNILSLKIEGTAMTAGSSTPSSNQYYFDSTNKLLKLNYATDPNSSVIVAEIGIYLGTTSVYCHLIPTDGNSAIKFFEGYLSKVPLNKLSLSDSLFGSLPSQTSSIDIVNTDGFLQKFFHACSLKNSAIEIYHCLGSTDDVSNFKLSFVGNAKSYSIDDQKISITIQDRFSIFDQGFDGNYLPGTGLSAGLRVPIIFGFVDGLKALPETDGGLSYSLAQVDLTSRKTTEMFKRDSVGGAPANSTTRTFVDTLGIQVGDRVVLSTSFNNVAGYYSPAGTKYYVEVLALGSSGGYKYLDHAAIGAPLPATCYAWFYEFTRRADVILDGVVYPLMPNRDYGENFGGGGPGVLELNLNSLNPAGASLPRAITSSDTIFCRVYGLDLSSYGYGIDSVLRRTTNIVTVIRAILELFLGLSTDSSAFSTLEADSDFSGQRKVCSAFPRTAMSEFPTYREVLGLLLSAGMLKLFINDSGLWSIKKNATLGAADKVATDDDILFGSFNQTFNFDNILSDVIVEYAHREISQDPAQYSGEPKRVYATSKVATFLHATTKQQTFDSPFYFEADATELANRLISIFGDRQGEIGLQLSKSMNDLTIGQTVEIQRAKIAGFAFDPANIRSRKGSVISIDQGNDAISVALDDQKGFDGT